MSCRLIRSDGRVGLVRWTIQTRGNSQPNALRVKIDERTHESGLSRDVCGGKRKMMIVEPEWLFIVLLRVARASGALCA